MSVADLFAFSGRALRGHRLRAGLSLLGVAIGVASVIVLTSLGEGARAFVTGEFASLGSNLMIILPGKTETSGQAPIFGGVPHDLTIEDTEAIMRYVRSVRRAAPLSMGEAPARYGSRTRDMTVVGSTSELQLVRHVEMQSGRYLPEAESRQGERVCVLGATARRELFGEANPLGELVRLGDERFRVVGVMAPRGQSIGFDFDETIHVPVRAAMRMFNRSGLFRVFIEVNAHSELDVAAREVVALVTDRHDGEEDVTVITQDAVVSTLGKILGALTAALGGIAAVSLSVAGIGIMNVMLVSVSERTSEVGLLKALGAGSGQILGVFLAEASILSTMGGLMGLVGGLLFNELFLWFYPSIPVAPPLWAVVGSVVLSMIVGVAFGALPARRAAHLDPIEALSRGGL